LERSKKFDRHHKLKYNYNKFYFLISKFMPEIPSNFEAFEAAPQSSKLPSLRKSIGAALMLAIMAGTSIACTATECPPDCEPGWIPGPQGPEGPTEIEICKCKAWKSEGEEEDQTDLDE
jgi:hypothetical protein